MAVKFKRALLRDVLDRNQGTDLLNLYVCFPRCIYEHVVDMVQKELSCAYSGSKCFASRACLYQIQISVGLYLVMGDS